MILLFQNIKFFHNRLMFFHFLQLQSLPSLGHFLKLFLPNRSLNISWIHDILSLTHQWHIDLPHKSILCKLIGRYIRIVNVIYHEPLRFQMIWLHIIEINSHSWTYHCPTIIHMTMSYIWIPDVLNWHHLFSQNMTTVYLIVGVLIGKMVHYDCFLTWSVRLLGYVSNIVQ